MDRTTWSDLTHPEQALAFFDRHPLPAFDPEAAGYRPQNAYWLAELSRIVYRDFKLQPSDVFLEKAGFRPIARFNSDQTGTQGFLVQSTKPSFAALVFRGTQQTLRDFLIDGAFVRVAFSNTGHGRVHAGFEAALESVWPAVLTHLGKLPPQCPVFYSGHSLGAALAILAAARRPPRAAYVFGAPLVGDAAFAASLKDLKLYRVVDGSDVVTMLPPAELDFQHGGELHAIGTPIAGFQPGSLDELKKKLVKAFLALPDPPQLLADHAPINYVNRV
jgi:triacylglycerol lipase